MKFVVALALFVAVASAYLAPLLKDNRGKLIEGSYLVRFHDNVTEGEIARHMRLLKSDGAEIVYEYKHVFRGYSVKMNDAFGILLKAIRLNENVKYVEQDQIATIDACQTVDSPSWGLARVSSQQVPATFDKYHYPATAGEGVTAYILDTGTYVEHNDFEGRASFGFKAESGWSDTDGNGHGTHVSSTVAGKQYGLAKKAHIVAVKVLSDGGSGSYTGVVAGVDWVAGEKKKDPSKKTVANMSLGGGKYQALDDAVNAVVDLGVVFAVAAGNDNRDAKNYSPAGAEKAVTVCSTAKGTKDTRSYFSNYGAGVDICAPGSDITGAWIGSPDATRTISGTSMASPHVCGVAALYLGENLQDVKQELIKRSVKDVVDLQCSTSACQETPNRFLYNTC